MIEGPSGRRQRTEAERARIAAKSLIPGMRVADIARKHGTIRWQIYNWRNKLRIGHLMVPEGVASRLECPILNDLAQERGCSQNKRPPHGIAKSWQWIILKRRHNIKAMGLFSRMIFVLVLAVFAAGPVVHAAEASTMAIDMAIVEMTHTDAASMGSAECDACGDEGGTITATCDLVCSTGGFAAVPVSDAPEFKPTMYDLRRRFSDVKLSGVGNLPLRDPPRPIL